MTETIVAAILTGILLALLVPSLTAIRRQRELQRFEALALIEINNQAEVRPETSAAPASPAQLSAWFQARYPDARIALERIRQTDSLSNLEGVRFTIARSGQMAGTDQKISIVVWYPPEGVQP